MITEITADNYESEVLKADTPVIVDFWASWCGPCKMMGPVFDELSGEYAGKLKFAKCSTEDFPDLASSNNVQGIPCLIVFKDGAEVDRIVGFAPKEMLKAKIDDVLDNL